MIRLLFLHLGLIMTLWSSLSIPRVASSCTAFTVVDGVRNGPYITFRRQVTNTRADFDLLHGTFRCKNPGLFFFSFSAISDRGENYRISLRKNRYPVVAAFSSKDIHGSASNSAILYLVPGDVVYLFVEEGSIYEFPIKIKQRYTTFTGFQLGCDWHRFGDLPPAFGIPLGRAGGRVHQELGEPDVNDNILQLSKS